MGRLLSIGFVWVGCALAWVILGSTLVHRSGETSGALDAEVRGLWGPPMVQLPPQAIYERTVTRKFTTEDPNRVPAIQAVEREETIEESITLVRSNIETDFGLQQRRKGLLWFPTYRVAFKAGYAFRNDSGKPQQVTFRFPLQSDSILYDGFRVTRPDGGRIATRIEQHRAIWRRKLKAGERLAFEVRYRTRGTTTWYYGAEQAGIGGGDRVRSFALRMKTNFQNVDFPAGTISPSSHHKTPTGWSGTWKFSSLVSSSPIGMAFPQKLNPGPLAARITFFAPVGLLFFFFVVGVLATVERRDIHPLNYFFFGTAFFAFHLLFAYLVDHVAVLPAFIGSAAVSIFLVVTYGRLFAGWRFALLQMGLSQLIYLVLFSYTFFWKGFTGLAVTIGAIITLFIVMQITGRTDWAATLRRTKTGGQS